MLIVCLIIFAAGLFIYPVTCQYYQSMRSQAQLEAEYAALQERNGTLQEQISYLGTDQGVEDYARDEFGYVFEGENAVTVGDAGPTESLTSAPPSVKTGSVSAPDTWYSGVLDFVFRYNG